MPYKCKICGKSYLTKNEAVLHAKKTHNLTFENARKEVYHTNPGIEKHLEKKRQFDRRAQMIENIRTACKYGTHYPGSSCQCPVCGAERSKSYFVYYDSPDLRVHVIICRDCFKTLANGPQSVYSKSILDGDYESNK